MTAYYNENDPFAAAWLRQLIHAGAIAPGDVDERSIADIRPSDIIGYDQYHFFAGIGVWSYALRLAGWPDGRPIWTGSCPCQPFSSAGKGGRHADERHLWPAFHHLIGEHRPDVVVGEQVASRDGLAWLDLVHADLEASGYAVGAADTCAAGIGAPHIRQRLWWIAQRLGDPADGRREPRRGIAGVPAGEARLDAVPEPRAGRSDGGLADADEQGSGGRGIQRPGQGDGAGAGAACERLEGLRADGGLADAEGSDGSNQQWRDAAAEFDDCAGAGPGGGDGMRDHASRNGEGECEGAGPYGTGSAIPRPGPVNGFWGSPDWLFCRDGKWRPVEPGTFPLAHGAAARVGRLRGYGNAVVAEAAKTFIQAVMDVL